MSPTATLLAFVRQITERFAPEEDAPVEATDERLAVAALLASVARVDGTISAGERERLALILADRFALSPAAGRALVDRGDMTGRATGDIDDFVDLAKRGLDAAGRRQLVHLAWDVARADGRIHELEDALIWRAARMLGLSEAEAAAVRAEALGDAHGETA